MYPLMRDHGVCVGARRREDPDKNTETAIRNPSAHVTTGSRCALTGRWSVIAVALALSLAAPVAGHAQEPSPGNDTPTAPVTQAQPTPEASVPVSPPADMATATGPASSAPAGDEAITGAGTTEIGALPRDLSPWGMFMQADWVVRTVMIGLAIASLLTWIIWLAKSFELFLARLRVRRTLGVMIRCPDLIDATRAVAARRDTAALLLMAANDEMRESSDLVSEFGKAGIKERVSSRLSRIEVWAGRRMIRSTGVLASIGAVAPFVGLFGTVWGIMNAFIGISETQTTNLAVVAPGIAEALLATALGLVAAIPAVVIYNILARSIAGYRQLLADVSATVERLVSRDLDRQTAPPGRPKAARPDHPRHVIVR